MGIQKEIMSYNIRDLDSPHWGEMSLPSLVQRPRSMPLTNPQAKVCSYIQCTLMTLYMPSLWTKNSRAERAVL